VKIGFNAFQSGFDSSSRPWNRRATLGAIMLLLSLALLSGCFRDPNVRKHKYLESGQKYSAQGKDREAAIQFFNALKIDKNFADAHYALAKAYLHMGTLNSAYSELLKTVDLQPANYKARIDLGNLLLAGGKVEEAQAQAAATLTALPNDADAHALLARIAARRGQKDVAMAEIHRALEIAPNDSKLHETLALLEAGDSSLSSSVEDEMKKAIALDAKSVNAKLMLAAFYVKNGRLQDAEQVCWSAAATDPKSLAARQSLVQVILKQGDQARAEKVLRQTSNDLADNAQGVRLLADYYTASGQIEKARAEFASLAQKYPKNLPVQEGYVRILLQVKDFATAQNVVTELMKKNGKDPQVIVLNGIVLFNNGKLQEAIDALQKAANDDPRDAFIQFWLGKVALAKGDSGLAQKSFQQAVQLNPPGLEAEEELARIASLNKDLNLMSEVAERTIAAAPRFADGYVWRATLELDHNAPDKAEADLKTAMTNAPKSLQPYLMLGEIRYSQKKFPEGTALLEQALQNDPNSIGALRRLVNYDLFKKQPEQALARINAQIAKSPKNSGFYDLLAGLQIGNKNLDQAAVTARKAMEINPDDDEAISIYSGLQVRSGQSANAIGAWEQWTKAHPGDATSLVVLGSLEQTRGNRQKAEDYYKKALQIKPQQPVAANNLAYMMLENGENVDVALTLAQTARRSTPDSPSTADTLAWAYYYKGTYSFARDLLEDAIKKDPNSATKEYHLGMVYSKLKDKNNAAVHLKKAVSLAPDSQAAKDAKTALAGLG